MNDYLNFWNFVENKSSEEVFWPCLYIHINARQLFLVNNFFLSVFSFQGLFCIIWETFYFFAGFCFPGYVTTKVSKCLFILVINVDVFPRLPSVAICSTVWLIYWKFVYCLFAEKTWGNVIAFFLLIYFLTLDLFYFPSVSRQPKVVLILIILHFSYKSCVYYIQFIWSIEDFSYEFFFILFQMRDD